MAIPTRNIRRICLSPEAFAKAIESLSQKGGGHLIVPCGVWLTGPIVLKSNIDLHLEAGAVIQFAADETLYPIIKTSFEGLDTRADETLYPIIKTSFEGLDTRRCQSPISANGATNIAITGRGAIDGNGQYWRPVKKAKVSESHWKQLLAVPGSVVMPGDYWAPTASGSDGQLCQGA